MAIWKISLIHRSPRCGGVPNGSVLRRICMMRPQAKLTKLKKHLLHRRSIYLYFSTPGNIIVVDLLVAKKVTRAQRAQTTNVLGMRLMATRWSKMLETLDNVPLHAHNKDRTLSSPRVNPAWTIGLQTCIVLLTFCCFAGRSRHGACRDKTKIAALARTVWSL